MIRPARHQDASRLAEILIFAKRTAYRPIFRNDIVSFNEMQVLDLALYYQNTKEALDGLYVYDDGIIKGLMHWQHDAALPAVLELKELYVDPFFQKEGIGTQLMTDFFAQAHKLGITDLYLWVLESNHTARRFYEKFGYQPTNERKLFPTTDKYLLKYTKTLNAQLPLQ